MIHKACMPVYMNSGKIVADGRDGKFEGSTRGPRGPKNHLLERVVNGMVVNTWCEKVHPAKGDGGDGHVAEQEQGVGDAQRGEQQVEHIVHLPESHQW